MDSGAELVCRVENTMCPVNDASTPMETVSPDFDHDDVGVSPQNARA
jgi:hypothetical protein